MYKSFDPTKIPHSALHKLMLGAIAPRPIAFASTIDKEGRPNLSPFSFFNAFGVNPSTIIFSPSRRGRDNTTKDTFENLKEVPEVVINAVTFSMVEQVSLASTEFAKGVNEFEKAGFTALPSEKVKPFRVKESPVQWECRVRNIIETGQGGGAANLVICEVLLVHVNENFLTVDGQINTPAIDLIGRMGGDYYVRAHGNALFEVEKPLQKPAIGIDALPYNLRFSPVLTGNELGRLGSVEFPPTDHELKMAAQRNDVSIILDHPVLTEDAKLEKLHETIRKVLIEGHKREALSIGYLL
ncbi:MAG: flavin reductase family protein [Lentimicrobiaceae bacterium]|nr:flavin reductase family protein [Lentimicrobiaceae bacterium]MCB9024239.1 flavin reductase family protein [Lentimicrobiaceae bacterium]MCO5266586.1 flavin reductase family protein [Lentimicrobium sp.]HPG33317.1 flavin reductase family protein [Lentimicrobium sp.]